MATKTNVIVLTLAARTAGVVTRAELREAGLAGSTISSQVDRGFLVRVWRGLYEVPELTDDQTPFFRALKSAPGAVVSHQSAARLWGFPIPGAEPGEPIHLTARSSGTRSELPGIALHWTRRLRADEVGEPIHRLATTSPARTILDLAGTDLGNRRLGHVVETQTIAGQPTPDELVALLDHPGRRGVRGAARLRRLMGDLVDHQPVVDSMLERRFAQLLRQHRLGRFERQVRPPWYDGRRGVVDFADRSIGLIVEVDGRRWHATSQAMADDRRRDRLAAANGWLVVRVTWADVVDRPGATVEEIAGAIEARRQPGVWQLCS